MTFPFDLVGSSLPALLIALLFHWSTRSWALLLLTGWCHSFPTNHWYYYNQGASALINNVCSSFHSCGRKLSSLPQHVTVDCSSFANQFHISSWYYYSLVGGLLPGAFDFEVLNHCISSIMDATTITATFITMFIYSYLPTLGYQSGFDHQQCRLGSSKELSSSVQNIHFHFNWTFFQEKARWLLALSLFHKWITFTNSSSSTFSQSKPTFYLLKIIYFLRATF